ncbi:MAG: hypothetical protein CL908_13900, partial [Deltaproteobacteria bacterium]|nr:hypothetical protein [Deltaproteobacteria bacterium]
TGCAALALGLLGRADPSSKGRRLSRLQGLRGASPDAVQHARRLLVPDLGPARPARDRVMARIGGGNALFLESGALRDLLDLASRIAR